MMELWLYQYELLAERGGSGAVKQNIYKLDREEKDYAVKVQCMLCTAKSWGGSDKCIHYAQNEISKNSCVYRNTYKHNHSKKFPAETNPGALAICTWGHLEQ